MFITFDELDLYIGKNIDIIKINLTIILIIFIIETALNLFTGYYEAGILVMDFFKSIKYNLNTRFFVDFLSTFVLILVLS